MQNPETEETFELETRRDNALDVYYHPFAYMAAPRAAVNTGSTDLATCRPISV